SGLSELDTSRLLQNLGLARLSRQVLATIMRTTRGNPLFVQEVLHQLAGSGALRERDGALVCTVSASDIRLPAEVTEAIEARVRDLDAPCRELLTTAAVLGDDFSFDLLCWLAGGDEEAILRRLEDAVGRRLLLADGETFRFAHPLVRHVLYSAV